MGVSAFGRHVAGGLAAAFAALPAPCSAQDIAVDLELVLAADVSASIDTGEVNLQRNGYLRALADERVINAMTSGPLGRIAITFVEWAEFQHTVVDWTLVASPADAQAFAAALAAAPVRQGQTTSIRGALRHAADLMRDNGYDATRRVIDISGDGRDIDDEEVAQTRDAVLARNIVINALVINPAEEQIVVEGVKFDLAGYFRERVIGGPGAFVLVAERPSDFPDTLVKKLVLEIARAAPPDYDYRIRTATVPKTAAAGLAHYEFRKNR